MSSSLDKHKILGRDCKFCQGSFLASSMIPERPLVLQISLRNPMASTMRFVFPRVYVVAYSLGALPRPTVRLGDRWASLIDSSDSSSCSGDESPPAQDAERSELIKTKWRHQHNPRVRNTVVSFNVPNLEFSTRSTTA